VITETGIGYFDTHAGLVFFLLIGKWFQQKTYDTLSFDRDYKSYFPVAVSTIGQGTETTVPVTQLQIGDRIIIRNNELIPADAILVNGNASIDFSFVTGESNPVEKVYGEIVYAGGRQMGSTIELEVCKKVSQSYLTQLWNSEYFSKNYQSRIQTFQQKVSKYFTIGLLLTAFGSASWWLVNKPELAMPAFTAVLIIACPCALALSSPFALGTAMRILGKHKCYLKSPETVEHIARIDTLVFDKTGTITQPSGASISYHGENLSETDKSCIAALAAQSVHPLSKKISKLYRPANEEINRFREINGKGLEGVVKHKIFKLGSLAYVTDGVHKEEQHTSVMKDPSTKVFVKIGEQIVGYFLIQHTYRKGLKNLLTRLQKHFDIFLLSGDNDQEKTRLAHFFGNEEQLFFKQSPEDKMRFIESLHKENKRVMMIGDGLNDAGALKAADVGISVSEDTSHFSPASDVIMDATAFDKLNKFIAFSKLTLRVIHMSFIISLIYNIIGLSFAVQGNLSPLIAAILMPLSSVTVIAFTTISTTLFARKGGLA
jgi:Cu+-exporting ATPase